MSTQFIGQDGVKAIRDWVNAKEGALDTKITEAKTSANNAYVLAMGRSRSHVFETKSAMENALQTAPKGQYKVGDNIFITDTSVPDYWVKKVTESDGTTYALVEVSPLETQKVDLSSYLYVADSSQNVVFIEDGLNGYYGVALKSYVDTKADDNAVIKNTGTQVISGNGSLYLKVNSEGDNPNGVMFNSNGSIVTKDSDGATDVYYLPGMSGSNPTGQELALISDVPDIVAYTKAEVTTILNSTN